MVYQPPRCNCPDATNRLDADPSSRFPSRLSASDWSTGFNGIRQSGGYCIHELAVIRFRDETEQAFPNGIPNDLIAPPIDTLKKDTWAEIWTIPEASSPPIK